MNFSAKRTLIKSIFTAVLVVATASNAHGFDGKRQGFQIGLGVGAHTSAFEFEAGNTPNQIDAEQNLATHLQIGYGVTNNIALYVGGKGGSLVMNDEKATLAISGVGVTYYLSESSPSIYVTGLIGGSSLSFEKDEDLEIKGDGWLAGIGFEVADRLHLELSYGKAELANTVVKADKYTMESGFATINYLWY